MYRQQENTYFQPHHGDSNTYDVREPEKMDPLCALAQVVRRGKQAAPPRPPSAPVGDSFSRPGDGSGGGGRCSGASASMSASGLRSALSPSEANVSEKRGL